MTPQSIATDTVNVYFTDTGNGSVNVVPKAGGSVLQLATGQPNPLSVVVDDTYAYWSNNQGGAVVRTLKAGGDTVHTVTAATSPTTIAVDSTYVYFVNTSYAIARVPKSGGTAATFATSPFVRGPDFLAMYPGGGAALYAITEDGAGGYELWQIALPSGTVTLVMPLQPDYTAVAGNGTLVGASFSLSYNGIAWTDPSVNGYNPIALQYEPSVLAVAPCGFVWALGTPDPGLHISSLKSPSPASLLPSASPTTVLVDGDTVFWTDRSGAIGKVALP
jgi:hypothetical protein